MIDSLRPRELDVLRLLYEGLTNREIADRLYISVETVRWYTKEIYGKLQVHNRTEAVYKARQLGWLNHIESDTPLIQPVRFQLPPQLTPFVGREQELYELIRMLLNSPVRLVTIVGMGGVGKTRLAVEMANRVVDIVTSGTMDGLTIDGVYFVGLASLTDSFDIIAAIAEGIDYLLQADEHSLKQQLFDHLRDKHWLLVLDNCEHLLDGIEVVGEILQATSNIIIVATSRESLGIRGEHIFSLGGMPNERVQTIKDLPHSDALQLFVQCAKRSRSDFVLSDTHLFAAQHICDILEGLPLAIEIAATWIRSLTLAEIADELEQGIDILETKSMSIRAIFNRSWRLLTETERQAFERFSVFRGGCTREAAVTITDVDLRTLMELVDKSLLQRTYDGRFEIHELLRQYAVEQLVMTMQFDDVNDLHTRYYLRYVSERESQLKGYGQLDALNQIDSEFENIRKAWYFALKCNAYDLIDKAAEGLFLYLWFRFRVDEGQSLLLRAIESISGHPEFEQLWVALVAKYGFLPRNKEKLDAEQLSIAFTIATEYRSLHDLALLKHIDAQIAYLAHQDFQKAVELFQQALDYYYALNDQFYVAYTMHRIGLCNFGVGNLHDAKKFTQRSLDICREIGDELGVSYSLMNLAAHLVLSDQVEDGIVCLEEAIVIAQRYNYRQMSLYQTAELSHYNFAIGEFQKAEYYAESVVAVTSDIPNLIIGGLANTMLGLLASMKGDYETGVTYCTQGLTLSTKSNPFDAWFAHGSIALSLCGLDKFREAEAHIKLLVSYPGFHINHIDVSIACAVHILMSYHHQRYEQSIHYMSFLFNSNYKVFGWVQKCSILADLLPQLKMVVGTATFEVAWEQGQQLDINAIVDGLVESYH